MSYETAGDIARTGLKPLGVLSIKPGDVLVLSCKQRLPQLAMGNISAALKDMFGAIPILILDDGMEMSVVRKEDANVSD